MLIECSVRKVTGCPIRDADLRAQIIWTICPRSANKEVETEWSPRPVFQNPLYFSSLWHSPQNICQNIGSVYEHFDRNQSDLFLTLLLLSRGLRQIIMKLPVRMARFGFLSFVGFPKNEDHSLLLLKPKRSSTPVLVTWHLLSSFFF